MSKTETIQFKEEEYRQLEKAANELGFKTVDKMVTTAIACFIRNEMIEKEEVTVKIPKKLLAFLKDSRVNKYLNNYLSNCLTDTVAADIEAERFGDFQEILSDYGLKEEFKAYSGH